MISKLVDQWDKLTAPRATDEDEARREHIVNVVLVGASAIAFVYTAVTAIAYFTMTGVPFPVLLAGLVTLPVCPLCLWASHRGRWRAAALPVILALLALTIYGQYTFGEHDVTLILYAALVIIAGIAYGGRASMGAAVICVLSYTAVGWLQLRGALPEPQPAGLLPKIITIGACLAIIVLLQWLFISQLHRSLRESRALAKELRRHRDHLEELVQARTAALSEANELLQQEIAERKQAEAEKERLLAAERAQANRQAALLRLSAELAGTLEEDEICQRVARGLRDTLGYDFVGIFRVDGPTGDRVLAAHVGFDEPPTRLAPGRGLSERPLLDGQLHYTADVSKDPRYIPGMGGSEVDVPVRVGEELLGVLIAERAQIDAFSPQDLEVLAAAANQAGLAIGKARLLAAERERADQLDALRTTMTEITTELDLPTLLQAIVERAMGLLNATGGELGLYEHDSQQVRIVVSRGLGEDYVGTCHRLGEGGMGRVAETGESLIIPDYQAWEGHVSAYSHIHASMIAPLEVGGRLVGVIAVASTDPAQQFGPADLHLLELFAQQATIAIDNAGLYDQAQQEIAERQKAEAEKERLLLAERAQAKRQAALLRLSAELAATLEERDVCQRVVDGLHDTLGYDFVALFLVDEATGDRVLAATLESLVNQAPTRIPPGKGLSEDPLLDGQLHYTPDVSQDPRYVPGLSGSEVDVPVRIEDQIMGVLNAESREIDAFTPDDLEVLTAAAHQAGLAIGKARLLAAERQRADQLEALRTTMADITAELELSAVLEAIVERASALLDATGGELGLYDESSQEVRIVVSQLGRDYVGLRHKLGEGAMGLAAQSREGVIIEDYPAWERRAPDYADSGMHSVLAAPLEVRGRLVGVIALGDTDPSSRFDQSDLRLLTMFGQQASIAIENARLLSAERQRADELDALRTTMADIAAELELPSLLDAIVERAKGLLRVDAGELGLYDPASREVRIVVSHGKYVGMRHKLGEGAMGRVAASGEPLIIEDYGAWEGRVQQYAHLHASLSAPLQVRGRLVGVISVASTDPERRFENTDLRLLNLFAHQAAIAIENARLFGETERRAAEMSTLTEVGKALSSTLRVDEVVKLIYEQTRRVIPGEDMIIALHDEETDEIECAFSTNPEDVEVGARFPADTGAAGYVIQHGKSVLLQDKVLERMRGLGIGLIGIPPESGLGVPMLIGERVLGAVIVQDYTTPGVYDESHQLLLETIASQAAIAIENARLYDQAQREIAERVRAEEELRQYQEHLEELVEERTAKLRDSEERYRTLFDGVPVGLYRSTPAGKIVDANPTWAQMLGLPSNVALNHVVTSSFYVNPADRQRWQELMEREGVVRDFEVQARRSDGTVVWITDTARAVRDEQGQVLYYEGSMEDISERKRAEQELRTYQEHLEELVEERTAELRESEKRYRTLFDGVPIGLYRTTPASQILDFNQAAEQMLGYPSREAALAASPEDSYVDPRARPRWQALMEKEGIVRDFEYQARTYDDRVIWVSDSARAVKDEQGDVLYYEGSLEDITDRKRAEEELQQAKEAAEAANQAKSRFLANMSHELRTPLNAIIGFTRLVKRRSKDALPQKQLGNLDKVLISADHLLGLINDVLDLSKIEAGRTEVQPSTFTVEPLVDGCLHTVRPLLKSTRVRLTKEIEPDLPTMFTDQDKLRQILINLLSNAVKFTEEGTVAVRARRQDQMMVLTVADSGIGIPQEAQERIFEAFQQVDSSTTRRYGGTGLGLSISLQLARLLGGDISVESDVGVGSIFTLTVPIRYAAIPSARAVAPAPEAPPELGTIEPDGRLLILAIDDDPNVIELLQENLGDTGYQVIGATSGGEGLQKARALQPFAIILDILMSPMDGWQVLHELKADVITRNIPVVVQSIVDNQELGYRLGASDYLVKPFDREAILGTLARLTPASIAPDRIRLLVVDDDRQVLDLVSQVLEDDPYQISYAADGQVALDSISRQAPDIILLDLLMPRLDGFGVIEWLRQSPEHAEIPVIVLTAKTLTAGELAQLQRTVTKVIRKQGLERETLLQQLRTALQTYRAPTESGE